MKLKFKTNINCSSCVARVTPFLNQVPGVQEWRVDTENKDKILHINGDVSAEEVIKAVKEAGYDIEQQKGFFSF